MNKWFREVLKVRSLIGGAVFLFLIVSIGTVVLIMAGPDQDIPDTNVRVTEFQPKEYLNILAPTNIIVRFSRDLVPDDSLNILFADVPLEINPPISGLGKWTGNNVFAYYPDSSLRPSTEYIIKVKSSKTYVNGNRIDEPRVFKIRTPAFTVENVWTEIANVAEPQFQSRIYIHVSFNYAVDPEELKGHNHTNLRDRIAVNLDPRQSAPSAEFTFISEPFRQQEINGEFVFTITKGLSCVGGQIPMQADFRRVFDIPKPSPLVISSANPEGAGPNSHIVIELSSSVALDEVKDFISITPSIDYLIDQYYNRIDLVGNFRPGEVYTIYIRKGLRSLNGQILERDFSSTVIMGDLQPRIAFLDDGVYMSRKGGRQIAVETVNIDEISVEVEQVFVNNIVYYLNDYGRWYYGEDIGRLGRRIFFKDFKLSHKKNEPLTSTIDIGKIVGDTLQGIYTVAVRQKDRRWTYDQRRIMITDLGILARLSDNYLMVWVNSLGGMKPVSGADVTLVSRNNQALLGGKTDSRGVALFENIAEKTEGFEPFVITVEKDGDLSFLQFNQSLILGSDFDVSGRPYLSKGYESFIYSDRGVYRPGEIAHLISVVRGVNGAVPEEFPYILDINDPQGRDFKEFKLSTKEMALSAVDFEVPSFAKTGAYNILAKIGDDIIGQYSIQVEKFMPDRIKTTLTTDKDVYDSGKQVRILVNGVYLFGPPCSRNTVNGHLTIEADYFNPPKWPGYVFQDPSVAFSPIQIDLQSDALDDSGNHTYEYQISTNLNPPSSLRMLISGTVLEDGGRAVSAYKSVRLNPYPAYLGLKSNFDGYATAGQAASFSVVAVDGSGKVAPLEEVWVKFYRTVYQNIVRKDSYGIYRYISEEKDEIIDSARVSISDGPVNVTFTPLDYGSYKVRATSNGTAHVTAVEFYAPGWGYSPWSMANPDRIELELDKKLYNSGDKAKLLVKAPFEGKLLVTIEKDKVLDFKTYDLDSNTAEITLLVKKEYVPNVFVSATLIKSTTSLERFSPARAFGMARLSVDNSGNKLTLAIAAPDVMKPRQKLDIKINSSLKKGTKLTVAAVDVGILQLTDFKTPDPFEFFHGKKRPALQAYDIYSLIFPDIKAVESKLAPAGSAAYEAARKRHLNPITVKRVKPVALWSGVVNVGPDGIAQVSFDVPQFNGKLFVMAVGFNADKVGSASMEITVRDKIVIQESLPPFITGGDKIKTGVTVFNNTGKYDSLEVSMSITGPARILSPKSVRLDVPANGKGIAEFQFLADDKPGKVTFEIEATNGPETSRETVELANRPGKPLLTKHGSGFVKAGSPLQFTLPNQWIEGTAEYELRLSSAPAIRLAGGIQYLLSYPYGCIEQTTSKLFPMLYFNDLARFVQPEILGTRGQEYYIAEGLLKLSSMQLPSGAFAYWAGSSDVHPWGSVYACHFLVEARKAGYEVSDDIYNKMVAYLQRTAREVTDENDRGIIRIYAAYVLAKAGELEKSVINNLKLLNFEKIPLYSRFQLAAAIALTSGVDDALWLIPVEIHPLKYEPETGGYFDSDIRANSILLDVLSDIAPNNPSIPELVKYISDQIYIGEWYTTQSNAWALMALGKYFSSQEIPNYTGAVVVNGKKSRQFNTDDLRIKDPNLGKKKIEISITGQGTCYFYWQASGVSSEKAAREFDNRLQVRREYLDSNGEPLDLSGIKLGDQVVAKITAEALDKPLENVIVNDMLPSCFEIENPRILTSGKLYWLPKGTQMPSYVDIRDDRMILFTNLVPRNRFVYYYSLRVISRGDINVPPLAAECMYDPTIASAASSGQLFVKAGR